ncbi:hypothetical protein ACEUZ9_004768 [Paracoccus litorisediminis]|uniref:hypothetical protein n=1 Tax=Paracoccus litorisediminis TaxID=2006130 RepID=UPI001B8D3CF3|nr:hypothetical protein [Paracoccus litorisediminis]
MAQRIVIIDQNGVVSGDPCLAGDAGVNAPIRTDHHLFFADALKDRADQAFIAAGLSDLLPK